MELASCEAVTIKLHFSLTLMVFSHFMSVFATNMCMTTRKLEHLGNNYITLAKVIRILSAKKIWSKESSFGQNIILW